MFPGDLQSFSDYLVPITLYSYLSRRERRERGGVGGGGGGGGGVFVVWLLYYKTTNDQTTEGSEILQSVSH